MGNLDFSSLYFPLNEKARAILAAAPGGALGLAEAKKSGAPFLAYGSFLTTAINFVIVAFCIFMVVKAINRMKRREEAKPVVVAEVPADVKLLAEIRDLLKADNKPGV